MKRPQITQAMRREVAARDGLSEGGTARTACHYCATPLTWSWTDKRVRLLDQDGRSTPELDHVVALFAGGAHDAANLVPACLACNRRKGVKRAPKQTLERPLDHPLSDGGQPRPVPSRPEPRTVPPDPRPFSPQGLESSLGSSVRSGRARELRTEVIA